MRYRHVGKSHSDALAKLKQAIGQPDSGEREVRPVDLAEMRRFWSSAVAAGSETAQEVMRLVAEAELGRRDGVTIPLPLAQRILAALEAEARDADSEDLQRAKDLRALAAELRERVPR